MFHVRFPNASNRHRFAVRMGDLLDEARMIAWVVVSYLVWVCIWFTVCQAMAREWGMPLATILFMVLVYLPFAVWRWLR